MDTVSASELARELGTSVPRVVRAVSRLGLDSRRGAGRLSLDEDQARQVRDALGVSAVAPGLTVSQSAVLAAVARSPFGLPSARAVATRAGVSPTTAAGAVEALERRGLLIREPNIVPSGTPRRVSMLRANRGHPDYPVLAPALRRITPPVRRAESRVPSRLMHLFWNTDPVQLEVKDAGPYIAQRLLRTLDPEGLAWGARNLSGADWASAAGARGLEPSTRALALNLAAETR